MPDLRPSELLEHFGLFAAQRGNLLQDENGQVDFVAYVSTTVRKALDDPKRLHGQRAQGMFESLVISLGHSKLIKKEDSRAVFPSEQFRVPDYRIVLNDGTNWLVEVKNFYNKNIHKQKRRFMKDDYYKRLNAYASATGAQLKIAVFWARWSLWTLVSPETFLDKEGNVDFAMSEAISANEFSRLGDRMVGTASPLVLRIEMEPALTDPVPTEGQFNCVISETKLYCCECQLTDPTDIAIAWMFIEYGEWEEHGPETDIENGCLRAIIYRWEPRDRQNDNFEFVGSLSRMFSRYYASHTVQNGVIIKMSAPLRPKWFDSVINSNHNSTNLPLWTFNLQPNVDLCR